ncbi:High-affinity zinc uptake system protein ZnuA precursor [Vibrio aerogenes CECT 7868]|uniref:High-affinity zinc uptake system protein ZnuA n=1 Tax=Vibrio aerogenes CECT 7868 TaxID=1216006 RepID=A0A1M6CSY0_9VIBR|nr:zinc ABC transporter substrate-binding protein ZnuA [Vibrio aerogenes]SHI63973.1 High-affinity zinc uptake system protein ZnuA precursor [Vibrio aerogenes CECT 7868]
MKYFRSILLFIASVLISYPSLAMNVLTSVKPIQLICYELMAGVSEPDVLLAANTSPHDYALRPSDVKRIRKADLIIWFGEGLEPFLTKSLSRHPNVLTISQLPDIHFRHFEHGHEDDGHHHHGNIDPHFWLGIDVVRDVATAISKRLVAADPKHAERYQTNLSDFIRKLDKTDTEIKHSLASVHEQPYYVFHDAYGYFEKRYGLNNIGHFTVNPDRKPGAKTLVQIRRVLSQQQGVCIFSEPQFLPAVIHSVTRGTHAKQGTLDPLATNIEVSPGGYFHFIEHITKQFTDCLGK